MNRDNHRPSGRPAPPERTPEQLLESVEAYIHQRAREMAPHLNGTEREDALQSGREQAWIAANRFAPTYGTRFLTYAGPYITGGIAAYLRGETKQTKIAAKAATMGIEYLAEEPDDFNILRDTDEAIVGKFQTTADRLITAMVLGLGTAPTDPEATLVEEHDRATCTRIVERTYQTASEPQQAILAIRYHQGRPMKDVERETGRADRSLRRYHEQMLDTVREQMVAAGITEPPEPK